MVLALGYGLRRKRILANKNTVTFKDQAGIKLARNPSKVRCKAKSRTTGKQCRRWSVYGYNVCYYHGANPKNHGGAPKNNRNAIKHGAYVNRLLDEDEEAIFRDYYAVLREDFELANPYERELAEKAGICYVRLLRALKGGSAEDIYKIDGLLSKKLARLKAIKRKRERDPRKITYEEWISDLLESPLLEKARAAEKGKT